MHILSVHIQHKKGAILQKLWTNAFILIEWINKISANRSAHLYISVMNNSRLRPISTQKIREALAIYILHTYTHELPVSAYAAVITFCVIMVHYIRGCFSTFSLDA